MKFNNRNFPHPVLGIEDDFSAGEMAVELKVSTRKEYIEITPIFRLNSEYLQSLISNEHAVYVAHVYCRGTVYREVFTSKNSLAEPIRIPANFLNGSVDIDFFVCTQKQFDNYHSSDFNIDYHNTPFSVDKSDIIAYAGKGTFYANKKPIELQSVSALMNIDSSGKSKVPMYLDYEGEKITIMLCTEDYQNYKLLKNNKSLIGVILSSIVLPALIDALFFLEHKDSENYRSSAWYKALSEIKETGKKKYPDPLRLAQKILDLPLYNCFELLVNENQYE